MLTRSTRALPVRANGRPRRGTCRRWLGHGAWAAGAAMALVGVNGLAGAGPAIALHHGPVPAASLGCLWPKAPGPSGPILSTAQVSADLGQTVKFGGATGPVSNLACTWEGKALPKVAGAESPKYTVQLWLDLYYSPTKGAATKLYGEISTGFGKPTPVSGIGTTAAYIPGQDIVTTQLVVRSSDNVFVVQLSSTEPHSAQDKQLATVARQVVTRLAK